MKHYTDETWPGDMEADGEDVTVTVALGVAHRVYRMRGQMRGLIIVCGAGAGSAYRTGAGDGSARREGTGDGDAWRIGAGDGNAWREDEGDGSARRLGDGEGSERAAVEKGKP